MKLKQYYYFHAEYLEEVRYIAQNNSIMCVHAAIPVEGAQDENLNVTFRIRVKLYKATCANTVGEQVQEKVQHTYLPSIVKKKSTGEYCIAGNFHMEKNFMDSFAAAKIRTAKNVNLVSASRVLASTKY